MITIFEEYKNITDVSSLSSDVQKPDVNSLSPEFWEMVEIADWYSVMKAHKANPIITGVDVVFEQAQNRIYSVYEYYKIRQFLEEYHPFHIKCYEYFEIFYEKRSMEYFEDIIGTMIGKGKEFTIKCINNPKFFIKMYKDDDFEENFIYLLNVTEEEYWEIRAKYDPFIRDIRKYNV